MLANIHVKNMALIKEADISLGKGLNILSGETGAGKSILLGSIAVALGLQNFKGFAREDADYALSELVFVIENEEQRQALLELEIPVEDGEVIISRRLSKGRTTSKINGETVPVSMVRKAGTLLIDIHGQHENQSLLHIRKHLELLDDFAGEKLTLAKENYKTCYQEYGELKKELQQAQLDKAVQDYGAQLYYGTAAQVLVQNDNGDVVGVIAKNADGKIIKYNTKMGVVMCGGD